MTRSTAEGASEACLDTRDTASSCPAMHGRLRVFYTTIKLIINYEKSAVTTWFSEHCYELYTCLLVNWIVFILDWLSGVTPKAITKNSGEWTRKWSLKIITMEWKIKPEELGRIIKIETWWYTKNKVENQDNESRGRIWRKEEEYE
jgi:hypothetical protein